MNVLVFAEQHGGQLKNVVFQALGLASGLADSVSVLVAGAGLDGISAQLSGYGIKKIYIADSERLAAYSAGLYGAVAGQVVKAVNPGLVLFGATSMGKDLAPMVAAGCCRGVISDVISLSAGDDGKVTAKRPVYAGKVHCEVKSGNDSLQFVTIRQNIFPAAVQAGSEGAELENVDLSCLPQEDPTQLLEVIAAESTRKDLTEAEIIVSGGRGLKGPEHFDIIEALADTLGAAVGASRAAVDAGWKQHSFQVGLTGKTVSPLLYVACGISGAVQHLAGMSSSKYIVAINKDPDAPMFKIASYGIVGDLFEIVPLLTEELKKLKH